MKSNDFNKIAFIYDWLAKLVFGKSIVGSQQYFLGKIPDHASVLVLGGGSGWIIEKIFFAKPSAEVCYIEASQSMMSQAKKIFANDRRVQFILGTENDIPDREFNVVITNFYLDLFTESTLKSVLQKIKASLTSDAKWMITDFVNEHWWHRVMLSMMYFFFRITTKIEANKLPDWNIAVRQIGGKKAASKFFYSGFIEATVFQL